MYIGSLKPGDRIRIKQDFLDYDRGLWKAGQELTLRESSFLPYEGGHTLVFEEGIMRLGELMDDNLPVISNEGDAYFELIRSRA